jgi:hypothetical protein
MRSLARIRPALPPSPATPPAPDLWRVATAEHHAALTCVRDALARVVATMTGPRPDPRALAALGAALDVAEAAARTVGTARPAHPDDAALIDAADLAKRLVLQLRKLARAPGQNWHRDRWIDRIAATLGEAAALTPPGTLAG